MRRKLPALDDDKAAVVTALCADAVAFGVLPLPPNPPGGGPAHGPDGSPADRAKRGGRAPKAAKPARCAA